MLARNIFRLVYPNIRRHMAFGFVPQLDLELNKYIGEETDFTVPKHHIRSSTMAGSAKAKMAAIPEVDIDDSGRYKYILLKLWAPDHKDEDDFKYLVRGNNSADWHNDIFEDVDSRVSPLGLHVECVGGGRILHEPEHKKLFVYGYSQGYGQAKHSITCDLLRKKYPHYNIEWNDEGY